MPYKDLEKQKKAQHESYLRNMEIVKARTKVTSRIYHERNKNYVDRIKTSNPCSDCGGYFHPEAMHFDHIGTDKVNDISTLASSNYSIATIDREIAKCELVCANCHAVRSWERRNRL